MLFKFWVPKNHKHPHFHLQEIPWTLSASGEPFLVEREHHSLTIIKCTLNKYLELATLSYWIYTGRRKIPNQISARGIVISSSWKGDGWDWLCCVFYTHTHTHKKKSFLGSPHCGFLIGKPLFALKIIHLWRWTFAPGYCVSANTQSVWRCFIVIVLQWCS